MTTTAEKIKVMQAFEDGVEIQSMSRRSLVWCDTPLPSWDWSDNNYRIKPPDPKSLEHINELLRRQSAAEDEIKKIGKELALLRYIGERL